MKSLCAISFGLSLLLFTSVSGLAQELPASALSLLNSGGLRFTMPPGFILTPVRDKGDVRYDFVIKSMSKRLEIRYIVLPEKKVKSADTPGINYQSMLLSISLNISGGQQAEVAAYSPADVKSEFGADAGGTMNVTCNSEFGKGFTYCTISAIQKVGAAQAYTCFLYDELPVIMEALQTDGTFHALRFR